MGIDQHSDNIFGGPVGEHVTNGRACQGLRGVLKHGPDWQPDDDTDYCLSCDVKFDMTTRRHHCRQAKLHFAH